MPIFDVRHSNFDVQAALELKDIIRKFINKYKVYSILCERGIEREQLSQREHRIVLCCNRVLCSCTVKNYLSYVCTSYWATEEK